MITKQCLDIVNKAQIKNSKELKTHALRNYNLTEWARRLLSVLPRSFRYCEGELQRMWRSGFLSCVYIHTASSVLVWITNQAHSVCVTSAFLFSMGKAKWTDQVETWVAVEYGSLTKEKGQPGPGALKATDPTYFYMPQSNLPNIWVRQAGFKPIICLLFTASDKYPHQTEIQSLAGSTSSVHSSFGGKCPSLLVVSIEEEGFRKCNPKLIFKGVFFPHSFKNFPRWRILVGT